MQDGSNPLAHKAEPRPITFYAPGLRRYQTAEYTEHDVRAFTSISLTGTACALACDHCKSGVLRGMGDLRRAEGTLYDRCAVAAARGARGVLISGGCDTRGRVPLAPHLEDLARVRRELGLTIRIHPGLADEDTCAALAKVGIDGAMVDIIGHEDTISQVYHLKAQPKDYEALLERLERHGVPAVPHIVLGLHYGQMLGEWRALEMIARHRLELLVLVVLMPLSATPMAQVEPPAPDTLGAFFRLARRELPDTPVMLGCARPLGALKRAIDRQAIDAGLDGIAYPAEGMVAYARNAGRETAFVNACCGVNW